MSTQFITFILNNASYLLLTFIILLFLTILLLIRVSLVLNKFNKTQQRLISEVDKENAKNILLGCLSEIEKIKNSLKALSEETGELKRTGHFSLRRVGLVKFDAFEDISSNLSFAIALLNGEKTGVILSSIFGRTESRMYAKPVINGKSSYQLTEEELEAIEKAT